MIHEQEPDLIALPKPKRKRGQPRKTKVEKAIAAKALIAAAMKFQQAYDFGDGTALMEAEDELLDAADAYEWSQ
jgi:hypothetical protein